MVVFVGPWCPETVRKVKCEIGQFLELEQILTLLVPCVKRNCQSSSLDGISMPCGVAGVIAKRTWFVETVYRLSNTYCAGASQHESC